MNQHRWTCITTVVLTTVLAPITNVSAQIQSVSASSSSSSTSRSLPIITPLSVTELKTESATPKLPSNGFSAPNSIGAPSQVFAPATVPLVPSLPVVQSGASASASASATTTTATSSASVQTNRSNQQVPPQFVSPQDFGTFKAFGTPVVPGNSSVPRQATAPVFVFDNPSAAVMAKPDSFSQPPQQITVNAAAQAVVRQNGSLTPTKIINSTTMQAEVARKPQSAPSIVKINDVAEKPEFEGGIPVYVFESDRAQQIVATSIAQVGGRIVAPEPSISIPVQSPKQTTPPIQTPITTAPLPTEVEIDLAPSPSTEPPQVKVVATQTGQASWYGQEGGLKTANGERYNPSGLTAAHRTLPFGTKVRVTSLKTGKSVTVRINDRGPFRSSRIIDVSAGAAAAIGIKADGVGNVRMEVLEKEVF